MKPLRVISGGQTGVDRAALDAALQRGLTIGGWCPLGRRAEDGSIPAHYPLRETPSADYAVRTEQNVLEADATLILTCEEQLKGGTELTRELAIKHRKPWRVEILIESHFDGENGGLTDGRDDRLVDQLRRWLEEYNVSTLNVAGPRESQSPGVGVQAMAFLLELFAGGS